MKRTLKACLGAAELPDQAWCLVNCRGELGGFSVRVPALFERHAAARWAAIRSLEAQVRKAAETYHMEWPTKLVQAAYLDASAHLAACGICTETGLPRLQPLWEEWARQAPPAAEALDRIAQSPKRSLQGAACHLAEILASARL